MKFSKRRHTVPLGPIWAIMVAAKLDQSRVLVTKFHQNRSTLKGRRAGQRHTDRHTDRQTHRQTRLKVMSLQVCNRANTETSRLVSTVRLCPQFADLWSGSAESCGRNISGSAHRRLPLPARCCTLVLHSASSERIPFDRRQVAEMANFKMYLLRQFCSNRLDFFTIHRRHRRKK